MPILSTKLPEKPMESVAIDLFSAADINKKLLVMVDYCSRYLVVEALKVTDAENVTAALERMFLHLGLPETMKADNGPPFQSEALKRWCEVRGINFLNTIPYWPQHNAEVERQMSGIKRALMIAMALKKPWQQELNSYVLAYNTRMHATIKAIPQEVMLGRPIRTGLPSIQAGLKRGMEEIAENDRRHKFISREAANAKRHTKITVLEEGQKVWLFNHIRPTKLHPVYGPTEYIVVNQKGGEVTVKDNNGKVTIRNIAHVKMVPSKPNLEENQESKTKEIFQENNAEQSSSSTPTTAEGKEEEMETPRGKREAEGITATRTRPIRTIKRPERLTDCLFELAADPTHRDSITEKGEDMVCGIRGANNRVVMED